MRLRNEVLQLTNQIRKTIDQKIARKVFINEDLSPEAAHWLMKRESAVGNNRELRLLGTYSTKKTVSKIPPVSLSVSKTVTAVCSD